MVRQEIFRYLLVRTIGNFLLLFAIFGVISTFGPALYYEVQYRIIQIRGIHYTVQAPKKIETPTISSNTITSASNFGEIISGSTEAVLIPPDPFFSIVIPKIGASSRVFPNVDPGNPNEFLPILQEGVAHAKGTVFPGMLGNTYLFAHSTDNFWDVGRYNAVFYLLKDLTVGDEVVIFFQNERFNYKVTQTEIVDPSEVSYIVNSQAGKKQQLILQTCWPPGTAWKRLIVIAEPK